ncbi:MAG: hypothetical protein K0Q76_929 [Panacagrimonas sp.]|jgi:hypothetical protein|nr:DUF3108 domain-containing protein [Panacagrimonas sp.]MCC2655821.1 hypothetical protein [Panacagrimonas sp.]
MSRGRRLAPLALGLMLVVGFISAADAAQPTPSDHTYLLTRGMMTLGEARFTLGRQQDPNCWRYEYHAKPSGLARLFIGDVSERSDFCMADGKVLSQSFDFKRADKAKDDFSLRFDWQDGVVRSSAGEMRPLETGMVDRLAMQIAVQTWVIDRKGQPGPETFSVTKVEDERVKTYTFRITGRESVTTPAGTFDTVRVERVNDKKKSTVFWLAPSRGYAAVRVQQTKDGDEQIKMVLKN